MFMLGGGSHHVLNVSYVHGGILGEDLWQGMCNEVRVGSG